MYLIMGGAYQGKLDFAKSRLGVTEVFTCKDVQIDFSAPCINKIEEFTLACVREGIDPIASFKTNKEQWKDAVLICEDIFCGVVPIDDIMREWRQITGQLCQYLSREATGVSRIFCGLEQKLK